MVEAEEDSFARRSTEQHVLHVVVETVAAPWPRHWACRTGRVRLDEDDRALGGAVLTGSRIVGEEEAIEAGQEDLR